MNLLDYLKSQPQARERKHKNRAIGNVLRLKYWKLGEIERDKLAEIVGEVLTLDRQWRKILEENPDLRGTDYDDKTLLVKEKQRELGYG